MCTDTPQKLPSTPTQHRTGWSFRANSSLTAVVSRQSERLTPSYMCLLQPLTIVNGGYVVGSLHHRTQAAGMGAWESQAKVVCKQCTDLAIARRQLAVEEVMLPGSLNLGRPFCSSLHLRLTFVRFSSLPVRAVSCRVIV